MIGGGSFFFAVRTRVFQLGRIVDSKFARALARRWRRGAVADFRGNFSNGWNARELFENGI